jgi:hypothetical protein
MPEGTGWLAGWLVSQPVCLGCLSRCLHHRMHSAPKGLVALAVDASLAATGCSTTSP